MDNKLNERKEINNQNLNNEHDGVQSFVWSNYAEYDSNNSSLNKNSNQLYREEINVFIDNDNSNKILQNGVSENVIKVEFDGNDKKNKKNFFGIVTNWKFLLVVSMMTFVFTGITVFKTFSLSNKVSDYEEMVIEIDKKQSSEAIIYNDKDVIDENINLGAAMELVNCINSPLEISEVPDSIKSIIDEINDYYNQSNNYFAFKYKDIYTGFSISYNENQQIFAASTIKAPKDIYIYEMASLGKINLDDKLKYTSKYYNNGTGVLKDKKTNTEYDIRTLVNYSTVYSDNAAHNMLMDKYGRNNMLSYWKKKGTNVIFTSNDNWGMINAHDASIYMEELYKFYIENEVYGEEIMNNFFDAFPKFISGKNNYRVANKSGWAGSSVHDVSIVFADNPYIVVALSNLGNSDSYMSYFNKVNDFAYRLHTEYWKYKMDVCGNINQY